MKGLFALTIAVHCNTEESVEGIVSGQIPRPIRSIALVTLLVWGVGVGEPTNTARADDCLDAPASPAPAGSHWYYHMDRAKQRKCWYIRATDQPAQHAQATSDAPAAPTTALKKPATDSASAPMSINPGDGAAPPSPAAKPRRASMSGVVTDQSAQQSVQKGSTALAVKPPTASASAPRSTSSENPATALLGPCRPLC